MQLRTWNSKVGAIGVSAAAFMRVAGGPHSAMHVSVVTFFHIGVYCVGSAAGNYLG
jgi:hypothetical protein